MNWIQILVIIVVSTLILSLKSGDASPVGNFSTSTISICKIPHPVGSNTPPDCDNVHSYCCNPPLNSPSIYDLHDQLNNVIDLLEPACTNSTFKNNVSNNILN